MFILRTTLLFLFVLASLAGHAADPAEKPLRVAVAANFKTTLASINRAFTARSGIEVVVSSASTGVLASQVTHGAPFDILFAADRERAEKLYRDSPQSLPPPFCYARGALVLAGTQSGLEALADPARSVAIANPATAPYGSAAEQVLARPAFAAGAERKLVRGANALQAYQFWRTGAVDLALLPRALVPKAQPVPLAWHKPIDQYAIVLRSGPAVARYLQWLKSDTVHALISQAGYEPCP